jgi:basic amino acid/polyamine antiporter, APA family
MASHKPQGDGELKRTLTATQLTLLGIGAIIGTGIFVLTGTAAAQYSGPAIVLSFIFSGIACTFAALCYAEFASMIPVAGSAYVYSYATMGRTTAWIIGWGLVLEYLFGAATVSVGWSGYVVSFLKDLGVIVPPEFCNAFQTPLIDIPVDVAATLNMKAGWQNFTEGLAKALTEKNINAATFSQTKGIINLPAMFIVAVMTYLLTRGIQESAKLNNVIVYVKVTVIVLFILVGFFYLIPENWVPFIPENPNEFGSFDKNNPSAGGFGHYGWTGILRGAGVIFFAYIGFDAVSTAAQETKNPQRDMPIGIIASLLVSTVLYILVALVLTGIVSYTALNVPDPIAVGVNAMGEKMFWLRPIIKLGAIAGLTSVVLVMLMGQSRIFFSMSNDQLLPKTLSDIHPIFNTPAKATVLSGFVAMIIGGLLPIGILGELVSMGTLLAFAIVCIGIIVLRKLRPDMPRPFKTPLVPLVPLLGAATAIIQMVFLNTETQVAFVVWMSIGLVIYFSYGRKGRSEEFDKN